ncbi:MAG: GHKL domain-containing protein [Oscillospiraceae bacterium]|nr:GHKL domain-containing protein [Oscillospiraceae bacterium]
MELVTMLYWAAAMLPVNLFSILLYDDLCEWVLKKDDSRRNGWPAGCAAATLCLTVIDMLPIYWWGNVLLTAVTLMLTASWFYNRQPSDRKLIFISLFMVMISFSDTLGRWGWLLIEPGSGAWPGPFRAMAGVYICLLCIFILVKFYIRTVVTLYRTISISWFLLFLTVPAACLLCCSFIGHLLAKYAVSSVEELVLILTGVAMLYACLAAFTLFESLVRHMERSKEYEYIRLRREMEKTHFELIEQKNDEFAGMVHDVKHHLRYLSQTAAEGDLPELRRYLGQLTEDFAGRSQGIFTDDRILNVILTEKAALAQKRGIDFSVKLTASISFLNPVDACTLMGNLLDNAIEGASKAADHKYIRLQIRSFNAGFVIIRVENSFSGQLKIHGKRLLSSKSEGHHGYGMRSIEQIAERNGGSMEYQAQNGVFCTTVLLSMVTSPYEDE